MGVVDCGETEPGWDPNRPVSCRVPNLSVVACPGHDRETMHTRMSIRQSSVDRITIPSQDGNASSLFHAAMNLHVAAFPLQVPLQVYSLFSEDTSATATSLPLSPAIHGCRRIGSFLTIRYGYDAIPNVDCPSSQCCP